MSIFSKNFPLPLRSIGLTHLPAVPFNFTSVAETLVALEARKIEASLAADGLTTQYTIDGNTARGYDFLYGKTASNAQGSGLNAAIASITHELNGFRKLNAVPDMQAIGSELIKMIGRPIQTSATPSPLTSLALNQPGQFTIAWTTFQSLYTQSLPLAAKYADALTSAEEATAQFWPLIAKHGQAYNLLILHKVTHGKIHDLQTAFGSAWTSDHERLAHAGELFYIDLRLFGSTSAGTGQGNVFTPSTLTLLHRDPRTKQILPIVVLIEGGNSQPGVVYSAAQSEAGAWIFALEAVRTSVTVWGIAIGHVYHWHLATAALAMTFGQCISASHPLKALLGPQLDYLIGFDDALLLLWHEIVPPMSISTGLAFLQLADRFATGRTFYDDDPLQTIAQCGLLEADFTDVEPWDLFPVAQDLLTIWSATEAYIESFVRATYAQDGDVAADKELQQWMAASSDPANGNVTGLGIIHTKQALQKFLQSLLFRVTMHGISRINETANPALSFVSNYPTCLNGSNLPPSSTALSTQDILDRLPNTGQIGQIFSFYSIFVFSMPYESFIPEEGIDRRLQFPGGPSDPRNAALIQYRNEVATFITTYQKLQVKLPIQRYQWPLCIET